MPMSRDKTDRTPKSLPHASVDFMKNPPFRRQVQQPLCRKDGSANLAEFCKAVTFHFFSLEHHIVSSRTTLLIQADGPTVPKRRQVVVSPTLKSSRLHTYCRSTRDRRR